MIVTMNFIDAAMKIVMVLGIFYYDCSCYYNYHYHHVWCVVMILTSCPLVSLVSLMTSDIFGRIPHGYGTE